MVDIDQFNQIHMVNGKDCAADVRKCLGLMQPSGRKREPPVRAAPGGGLLDAQAGFQGFLENTGKAEPLS